VPNNDLPLRQQDATSLAAGGWQTRLEGQQEPSPQLTVPPGHVASCSDQPCWIDRALIAEAYATELALME